MRHVRGSVSCSWLQASETGENIVKVTLNKYQFSTKTPEGAARYKEIEKICAKLGHKLFASIGFLKSGWLDKLPDEQTIEPKHLFSNQYNTVEGFRIFDWKEEIAPQNPHWKEGYYLTGDGLKELQQAKANRCACGYCGAQYEKPVAPFYCAKCIGSEYLTEKNLPLLLVTGIMEKRPSLKNAPPALLKAWKDVQPEMERLRSEATRARMLKKADQLVEEAKKKSVEIVEEANMLAQLLRANIDTENLIHYPHTGRWCWGWRSPLSEADIIDLEKRIRALPGGSFLLSQMDFKQENDQRHTVR